MENQIVFVTSNKGKLATAQKYLGNEIKLVGYDYDIVEPDINDIEYIAKYKLEKAYEKVHCPCITLDAGFFIPEFPNKPNFPGAFVRRELLEKLGIDGLLKEMKGVKNRECYFKECLAYFDGQNMEIFFGYNRGILTQERLGGDNDKKWSDLWQVFIPEGCQKTLAQMTEEERTSSKRSYKNPFLELKNYLKNNKI